MMTPGRDKAMRPDAVALRRCPRCKMEFAAPASSPEDGLCKVCRDTDDAKAYYEAHGRWPT